MKFGFIFLVSILVLSLYIVSADTSFKGEIREDNPFIGALVENATVTVTCNGNTSDVASNVNGVYSVSFLETACNISDAYVISVVKGNWSGNISGNAGDLILYNVVIKEIIITTPVIGNTTINGTIYYNSTNGNTVDGANVTVDCNGNDLDTISVNGNYFVDFSESVCNSSHVYSVFAESGEYNGTSGYLNVSDGTVADVVIKKAIVAPVTPVIKKSSGGGSGGLIMICGEWSECVGNVMTQVCNNGDIVKSKECASIEEEVVLPETLGNSSFQEVAGEGESPNGFFSAITGAVIGGGTGGAVGAGILMLLAVLGFVAVRRKRMKA